MPDAVLLAGVAVVAVVLVLLLLFVFCRSRGGARDQILLVGLSEAGKTHIFLNLVSEPGSDEGRPATTYTSLQDNVYDGVRLTPSAAPLSLVDVPGAAKVRALSLKRHLGAGFGRVAGILFVVDASTFGKAAKDVAELLYELLSRQRGGRPLLAIACHKQDLPMAKSAALIRASLEKELALVERTRAAALDDTAGDVAAQSLGAVDWGRIAFLQTSGLPGGEETLRPIRDWLISL